MWHCTIAPLVTDRLSEPCWEMPLEKQCFSSWGSRARVHPSLVMHLQLIIPSHTFKELSQRQIISGIADFLSFAKNQFSLFLTRKAFCAFRRTYDLGLLAFWYLSFQIGSVTWKPQVLLLWNQAPNVNLLPWAFLLLTSELFHFYHCHHYCLPYFSQDSACHPKGKEWKSQYSRRRSWDISGWRSVLKRYHFLHLTIPMCLLLPLHPLCLICFSMHLNCVFCLKPAQILPL